MDCSPLAVRNDFANYTETLLDSTHGDLHRLSSCRKEVCTAMWGAENSDISGIGMIVGYILDHILGLMLGIAVLAWDRSRHPDLMNVLERGLSVFHDCASFFAFSIEVACIVMLIKADLGISTSGMGDYTLKITYAVAMLVLLPLIYAVLAIPAHPQTQSTDEKHHPRNQGGRSKPLMLFVLCWALAFYPFYSAMNAAFGPSLISSGENAALSKAQLRIIKNICFRSARPVSPISQSEANVMTSFVILTYIPVSVALITNILWSGIKSNHEGSALHRKLEDLGKHIPSTTRRVGMILGLAAIPTLAAGLLWSVFRARQAQKQLAYSLHSEDGDDDWTFGQVAAVTLFTPVAFECWSAFVSHRRSPGRALEEVDGAKS